MKLSRYMQLNKMTDSQLAQELGKARTAVLRYRHGTVVPSLSVASLIEKLTDGAVTYRDFIEGADR